MKGNTPAVKKMLKNRRGSVYPQAAMVMPTACIIAVSLIGISMSFYGRLATQAENHEYAWQKFENGYEADYLRTRDALEEIFRE